MAFLDLDASAVAKNIKVRICQTSRIIQSDILNNIYSPGSIETLREKPVLFGNLYPIQTCYIH